MIAQENDKGGVFSDDSSQMISIVISQRHKEESIHSSEIKRGIGTWEFESNL